VVATLVFSLLLYIRVAPIGSLRVVAQRHPAQAAELSPAARTAISRSLGTAEPLFWAHRDGTGWAMANRHQGFAVNFAGSSLRFAAHGGRLSLGLAALGFGRALHALPPATLTASRNRVSSTSGSLSEQFANGPLGLEQSFSVAAPPAGNSSAPLTIALTTAGSLHPRLAGGEISFLDSRGRAWLRYGGLSVTDARGRPLRSWLALSGSGVLIRIDAAHAQYPLRVDPVFESATLQESTPSTDGLGYSIAISGQTIVVGAPNAMEGGQGDAGLIQVFSEPPGGWSATINPVATLTASSPAANDSLGQSVAIDGATVVAGAKGSSAAYVFTRPGGGWSGTVHESAKLTSSATGTTDFGESVAVNGTTIVVGQPFTTVGGAAGEGDVDVFTGSGSSWSDVAQLEAADGATSDNLGFVVAMTGSTVVAGAPNETIGGKSGAGAAYVFTEPPDGWSGAVLSAAKFVASDPGTNFSFGSAVAIDPTGSPAVVGAGLATETAGQAGAAYVFSEPAGGWTSDANPQTETTKLIASNPAFNDRLGLGVAVGGGVVVASAPEAPLNHISAVGEDYVFTEPATGWTSATSPQTESNTLQPTDQSQAGQGPSEAVALQGTTVATGAPGINSGDGGALVFALPTSSLTVARAGSGSGSVSGSGISCPGTCSENLPTGQSVTLNATPAAGSVFAGWSGGGCSGTGGCQLQLNSNTTVTATFNSLSLPPPTHTLSVSRAGTGSGTVNGSGISCPSTCSGSYAAGSAVTLAASPAAGSTFAGWSGACTGTGSCHLTINANTQVTATFNKSPAPRCTLKVQSSKVLLVKPKVKKGHKSTASVGTLAVTAKCNPAVTVQLTGMVTELVGKKPKHGKQKTKSFKLGPVRASLTAGAGRTLVVKLPKGALRGLKSKAKEAAALLLVATNASGTARATAKTASLKGVSKP